jgi:hypothetical protein
MLRRTGLIILSMVFLGFAGASLAAGGNSTAAPAALSKKAPSSKKPAKYPQPSQRTMHKELKKVGVQGPQEGSTAGQTPAPQESAPSQRTMRQELKKASKIRPAPAEQKNQ